MRHQINFVTLSKYHLTKRNNKLIIPGDSGVGKTSLLTRHNENTFPEENIAPVHFDYFGDVTVDEKYVKLWMWDTSGVEGKESGDAYFENVNVLAIAFALDNTASFEHAKSKWHAETTAKYPNAAVILLGLKSDLRTGEAGEGQVTKAQGEALCKELKAFKYLECSARTPEGVEEVLQEAVHAVWAKEKKKGKCVVM